MFLIHDSHLLQLSEQKKQPTAVPVISAVVLNVNGELLRNPLVKMESAGDGEEKIPDYDFVEPVTKIKTAEIDQMIIERDR